jgi:hypothetical protein
VSRLDVSSLTRLAATLRALPTTLGQRIAAAAAPALSELAQEAFDSSTDPYGAPWAPAKDGSTVTLRKTGALEKFVHYVASGTRVRVSLGVSHAKYQIGLRPIYPKAGLLPAKYAKTLEEITVREAKASLAERGL